MRNGQYWFIGECMVELRRAGPGLLKQCFAGDVYNTAVYFERMTKSERSCLVSSVGMDAVSQALLDEAGEQGLDVRHVERIRGRQPGLYWIETDAQGERSFLYWRAQSAARTMLDEAQYSRLHEQASFCSLLYFSGITLAILDETRRKRLLALARQARASGAWVAFDSNYRPALWENAQEAVRWFNAAAADCTHALVTFEDEQVLHGDRDPTHTLERLLATGVHEAIVKLGAQGCLLQTVEAAKPLAVPALPVQPVDTTAAGDSFNAAYLAARIAGKHVEAAAQAGCRLAAQVISYPGAIIDKADWARMHDASG